MSDPARLRIGVLGAARIAPLALVRPARSVPEVLVLAVAARDEARARRFASRHAIPRVHARYAELLADPEIDAVYNPLPNSLHCEWTLRAISAGKHVLCEKPLAANAYEAGLMSEAARREGRVLVEAFHWRYHPLAARMQEIVVGGELGRVEHVEAAMCIPLILPGFQQVHDAHTEGNGEGSVADETGDHVGDQPVALEGGDEGLNAVAHVGR